jgi:hypothetical protein
MALKDVEFLEGRPPPFKPLVWTLKDSRGAKKGGPSVEPVSNAPAGKGGIAAYGSRASAKIKSKPPWPGKATPPEKAPDKGQRQP